MYSTGNIVSNIVITLKGDRWLLTYLLIISKAYKFSVTMLYTLK